MSDVIQIKCPACGAGKVSFSEIQQTYACDFCGVQFKLKVEQGQFKLERVEKKIDDIKTTVEEINTKLNASHGKFDPGTSELAINRIKGELREQEQQLSSLESSIRNSTQTINYREETLAQLRSQKPTVNTTSGSNSETMSASDGCGCFIFAVGYLGLRYTNIVPPLNFGGILGSIIDLLKMATPIVDFIVIAGIVLVIIQGFLSVLGTSAEMGEQKKKLQGQMEEAKSNLENARTEAREMPSKVQKLKQEIQENKNDLAWHQQNVRLKK